MKTQVSFKSILLFILFFALQSITHAQGIYQMWGSTVNGGTDNKGVLFTTKYDGTGYQLKKNFTVSYPGGVDDFNKPEVYNGKLYTALKNGGLNDDGIITEFNPATNTWSKKADFNSIGGGYAGGSLTLYNNKFYGVCYTGGANNMGLIFEFNPATFSLTKLYDFDSTNGGYPNEGLTVYNSKLYGVTGSGGSFNDGVVYEFNPATNACSKKASFLESTTGYCPYGTKLVVYNSLLWGATNTGSNVNGAAIFSFNPATNALLKKVETQTIGSDVFYGSLTLLNGKLYGGTAVGGANNDGVIFEYNTATNLIINKFDLTFTSARLHINFTAYNNLLYSCGTTGGSNNLGQLFSFNPVNNQYIGLANLSSASGSHGAGAVTVYNNKLWGFTQDGAAYGEGSLFSYDLISNLYTTPINLGGNELIHPTGALMYYNNKMYGTCELGGNFENDHGVGGIYEYDLETNTYNVKILLHDTMANFYDQGGFTLLNNKFYAVSSYGGINDEGSIIEYDPATNLVTKKHNFAFASGSKPFGRLSVYNGKLYGMCEDGSTNGVGNLYEYNPATNIYAQRVVLDQAKGSKPYGGLTWYNNKFYGVCFSGGTNFGGTIFEYNPAINSYLKKVDMDSLHGDHCVGGLTEFNNKLYGMTMFGGIGDLGTLFEYNPATASFTKKVDLNQTTGVSPYGILSSFNNKLFGLTPGGGNSNCGTLIQYDASTNTFTKKMDFIPSTGKRARSNQLVPVPAPTASGSTNSCTNTQTININAANANQWIAFTDAQGNAVAEINANGNILGNTAVRFYINGGSIRQDSNGAFYLDRSITITPTNQPSSNVSLRLYIRKAEFETIKNTAGSGVNALSDLNLVKNTDFCTSMITAPTTSFPSTSDTWGTDYVYTTNVNSLGSFYFIGNVIPATTILNLKMFIQGFYLTNSTMKPVLFNQNIGTDMNITDSIEVELHSAFFPFELITSVKTILNTNGTASCSFPNTGVYYYIAIKHRNTIKTWSSVPILIQGLTTNYDFSIASSQAYGNNMIQVEPNIWACYSGDVNQDENVDLLDASLLETDINNFQFGYLATDINGDGNVDLLDTPILETNITGFVFSMYP